MKKSAWHIYWQLPNGNHTFNTYLQHKEFTIATDHHSLIHLGDKKLLEGMQQKAFIKLLGLRYKIVYKKGMEN
jgi:hypothetical protein